MFAVVEIAGMQFNVKPEEKVKVPLLVGAAGDYVQFPNILTVGDGDSTRIGTPYIEGNIQARIIEHGKDEKVLIFHKKRRKGHRKLNGHRQRFTTIEITDFNIEGFEFSKPIVEKVVEEPDMLIDGSTVEEEDISLDAIINDTEDIEDIEVEDDETLDEDEEILDKDNESFNDELVSEEEDSEDYEEKK